MQHTTPLAPAANGSEPGGTPWWQLAPLVVGGTVLAAAEQFGGIMLLGYALTLRFFTGPLDRYELWRSLHKSGVRSLPIVAVTSLFNGAILVVQAAPLVERFGATSIIGWGAGFGIMREVGPLLIGLMYSGRVGANNTAELATMVSTEQFDALRALAIDPLRYLVLPRALAMTVMMMALDVIGVTVALGGAVLASRVLLDVDAPQFGASFFELLGAHDYLHGVVKSFVFGGFISITSCFYGISASGGAPGVGRAVNRAVVAAALGIFVLDFFATLGMQ
jgi:phospholipid/cholesterol/gamma-HCH transport system permease protein